MHDGKAGTEWILLPATPLENYAAALVSYLLVYPLAASLLATGSSAFLALVQGLVGGRSGTIWTPALAGGLELYAQYAIAAVVFLAGSASFRKRAVLKTAGLAVAYVFSVAVVVFLLLWAFFGEEARGAAGGLSEGFRLVFDAKDLGEGAERALKAICDAMYFGVLPLFALLYGYFRVFEKEARDEVQ
jgi:bacteriorhodopsin